MPESPHVVLYVHGFASSGLGRKADLLRGHYAERGVPFLAPSLSHIPELALSTLEDFITAFGAERVRLVGASLGGFYATYLSAHYGVPAVLINPVMALENVHMHLLGLQRHAFDGSRFECTARHFETLQHYAARMKELGNSRVMLLLQAGDEVVDHRKTLARFDGLPAAQILLEEGGSHLFDDLESKLGAIDAFLGLKAYNPTKKEAGK